MPKVSYAMIVFNGDYVLKQNLENIYPFAENIVIVEGPVLYYRNLGFSSSTDNTIDIIKNFPDPDKKITLIQGQWKEKDDMCQAYMPHLKGDYLWHIDSDELYKPEDTKKIFDYLDNNKDCYSMGFKLYSFYGGFDRYITGVEQAFEVHRLAKIIPGQSKLKTHRPPTLIWPPTGKTCQEMGHVSFNTTASWGVYIYHYSHVFPKQVKAKMSYYSSWTSIIQNYWERLYVPWMRAKSDDEKLLVEMPTKGVQEWAQRDPAYTAKFNGTHPESIELAKADLIKRICDEMNELKI